MNKDTCTRDEVQVFVNMYEARLACVGLVKHARLYVTGLKDLGWQGLGRCTFLHIPLL